MITYQDFLNITDEKLKKKLILQAISEYKASSMYEWAYNGLEYAKQKNTAILKYQKFLYTQSGKAVPDNFSANFKTCSNFFNIFITQENSYLLGNGVSFNDSNTKQKLGGSRFDNIMKKLGKYALACGVSYGFWNLDHLEIFKATEFVPLWDEETGQLMAGIRFWQLSSDKPLRCTLFEQDGYTDYIKKNDSSDLDVWVDKRPYVQILQTSAVDGTEIADGKNYKTFPVLPLWANDYHQSELVGIKTEIDCYDLIKSDFCNDFSDNAQLYYILTNCGGMDDIDVKKFIEQLKITHTALVDEDVNVKTESVEIPYLARETFLKRLEEDLFKDAMALNINAISSGNATATAIRANYELLNQKTDDFEYCCIEFIHSLLNLIDIDDDPQFKRNVLINETEGTNTILSCKEFLDKETILKKLPFISIDEVETILKNKALEQE